MPDSPASSESAHRLLALQRTIGNAAVQRFVEGADDRQTLAELIDSLGQVGAPVPPEVFLDAARRAGPDECLRFYLLADVRDRIADAYHPGDSRRIFAQLLRAPYRPGVESIFYDALRDSDATAFDEVNDEVNRRFVDETGITDPLDWSNEADRPFARRWLMLRDDVMTDRMRAEEDEEYREFKAEILAQVPSPAHLHTVLEGLDATERVRLLGDEGFKEDLRDGLGDWDEFARCIEDLGGAAPDAAALLGNGTVQGALSDAWDDSLPHAGTLARSRDELDTGNHEEGGWIYVNLITNSVVVRRQSASDSTTFETDDAGNLMPTISLEFPPEVDDCVLVANFHTHPNDPRYAGASAADGRSISGRGVPGLLRDSEGNGAYGDVMQRASLAGPRGYPL